MSVKLKRIYISFICEIQNFVGFVCYKVFLQMRHFPLSLCDPKKGIEQKIFLFSKEYIGIS